MTWTTPVRLPSCSLALPTFHFLYSDESHLTVILCISCLWPSSGIPMCTFIPFLIITPTAWSCACPSPSSIAYHSFSSTTVGPFWSYCPLSTPCFFSSQDLSVSCLINTLFPVLHSTNLLLFIISAQRSFHWVIFITTLAIMGSLIIPLSLPSLFIL